MASLFDARFFPLRYPVVGFTTYVLESGLFSALLLHGGEARYLWWYYGAGGIAFLYNFSGHILFTFKDAAVRSLASRFMWEAVFKVALLAGRGALLALLVEGGGVTPWIGLLVSAVAALATFFFTSYILGGSSPLRTLLLLHSLVRDGGRGLWHLLVRR